MPGIVPVHPKSDLEGRAGHPVRTHLDLMKASILIFSLLAFALADTASAQLSIRLGKDGGYRSGGYEGYWTPYSKPADFNHRMSEIKFVNQSRGGVDVYYVDRYGKWNWVKRLGHDESAKVSSPVGDVWVVRGGNGKVLQRVVAQPGSQRVDVRYAGDYYDGDRYGPQRAGRFDVVFRNRTRRPVTLYALQPWGEWTWAGAIPPAGGEIEVRAYQNQQFRVLDRRGQLVKQYRADDDDHRVTIDD